MPRVIHFEIQADDPERAVAFYAKLFDWKVDSNNEFNYGVITTGGEGGINGGVGPEMNGQRRVTVYAQVADGAVFGPVPTIRRPSERPISLDGNLTDTELLSLVGYIRSKPTPELKDGRIALGVSGTYPIRDIEQQKDGSLWVVMSLDGGVGETATVRRTKRGWQVTEVVSWVS